LKHSAAASIIQTVATTVIMMPFKIKIIIWQGRQTIYYSIQTNVMQDHNSDFKTAEF